MYRITLSRTPPSTQTIYRHKGYQVYMTAEGKDCKELYYWEIKKQLKSFKTLPLTRTVSVIIEFYFKDKRNHDIDNHNKLILDAGTGLIWKDDGQIVELVLRKFIDKENPRVEMTIL